MDISALSNATASQQESTANISTNHHPIKKQPICWWCICIPFGNKKIFSREISVEIPDETKSIEATSNSTRIISTVNTDDDDHVRRWVEETR